MSGVSTGLCRFALRALHFAQLVALSLAFLPFSATLSFAAVVIDRPLLFSFDGSDTTKGKFGSADKLDIDQATGTVYVVDNSGDNNENKPAIDKFNAAGEAQIFAATGESSRPIDILGNGAGAPFDIAIDNSSANPGRIYVTGGQEGLKAVAPSGFAIWELPEVNNCSSAVDAEGNLWISARFGNKVFKYNTGNPPIQIDELTDTSGAERPCQLALDTVGSLYIVQQSSNGSVDKYVNGVFDSTLDPFPAADINADQTKPDGHIFVVHAGVFFEYDQSGTLLGRFGEASLGGGGKGIAYYAALDRVYVATGSQVRVFGPTQTLGTAPDVTLDPVSSDSLSTAHFSGTINPLGLENSYHFEYKQGTDANWFSGVTSTPTEHIVPADSTPHAVSFDVSGLSSFTTYQVRLVVSNDELGIENASAPLTFGTGQFADLTIDEPSAVTARTAHISGTVDSKESQTTWRFQTSSRADCPNGAGFDNHPSHVIEADSGPIPVEEDLTGLTPNQHYCLRISATNSPGTAHSEIKQFDTLPVLPIVAMRGAAPRTETSVRLNAFVNPENAKTTYRFEYSLDGSSWTSLLEHDLGPGTDSVLVGEELTGLEPDTTYSFRLSAENVAGPVQSQAQSFTTLVPSQEDCPNADVRAAQHTTYLGSCRGIELVNSPEKGNQNAGAFGKTVGSIFGAKSPISADGNRMVWTVRGGAPGAPNGTEGNFLAKRTASGWSSQSIAPPAAEQPGKGDFAYFLTAFSPDLSSFLLSARVSTGFAKPPPPTIVRMREGKQNILKSYAESPTSERFVDLTNDGEHILVVNPDTEQLEDIGAARVGPPEVPGEVVSVMPDGAPSECGLGTGGQGFRGIAGSDIGQPGDHWIAATDASRIYFLAKPNAGEPGGGSCSGSFSHLYVRDRNSGKTTLIDPKASDFLTAIPNGHQAYFATRSGLDPADTDPDSPDLYRWDEDAGAEGESSCITCFASVPGHLAIVSSNNSLAHVLVSEDLSHVYFYSNEQLVAGLGEPGALNLYALSNGQVHFVAVTDVDVLVESPAGRFGGLSDDGNVLLFIASATPSLSSDAMAAQCIQANSSPTTCEQVYRYDDRDQSIECVSCDHDGLTTHSYGSPNNSAAVPDAALSGDGSTAAFATREALVPLDVNDDTDVYEWRDGTVQLITDGVTDFQEGFAAPRVWAVDEDGSDVFFGVVPPEGRLTGFERDGVLNVYDARVDGGFEPPTTPAHCSEDSCQGPLQPPPALDRPASGGSSMGNLREAPARCAKGKVRRRGRCIKRPSRKQKKGAHRRKRAGHSEQGRSK